VRRADALPAHKGRIRPDLAHGSAEANAHALDGTRD
jgi:hypothetical protein